MVAATTAPRPLFRLREYSRVLLARRDLRLLLALWRRQSGKTTTLALRAIREMATHPGRLITFASASLLVGREVIEKESHLFRELLRHVSATQPANPVTVHSGPDGKQDMLLDGTEDDFASLFESRRMVVKLHHDSTTYSRTQVIAPNPATARGFTGSIMIDECGLIPDFRDVWDAMEPIMSSDPTFTCVLATTPPIDDTHYSHELLLPPPGMEFPVSPAGNWYVSTAGIDIHRLDVHDGIAAGAKLFDRKTAQELTAEQSRLQSLDRESWARNYALIFANGGTAACSRLSLEKAQSHVESARCHAFEDEEASESRLREILSTLPPNGLYSLGFDVGTTEGQKSNPSSLTLGEKAGALFAARVIWRWKTKDDELALNRVRLLVKLLCEHTGHSPKALCIDASSEKYFANRIKRELATLVNVVLVVNGENLNRQGQTYQTKQYLGDCYTTALEDGHVALPASRWLFEDHRLVRKEKGRYEASVAPDGCHADSFDSNKLALFGFEAGSNFYTATDPTTFHRLTQQTRKERDTYGL